MSTLKWDISVIVRQTEWGRQPLSEYIRVDENSRGSKEKKTGTTRRDNVTEIIEDTNFYGMQRATRDFTLLSSITSHSNFPTSKFKATYVYF